MKVKVSVIIPVYNVENYLEACLDSVANQSLNEIEIICIDDGSTDNSPKILQKFQLADPRVQVRTIENSGQGIARNIGVKMAKGEFIGFVDSDDFIERQMFEKLYHAAVRNEAEIAHCFTRSFNNHTGKPIKIPYYAIEKEKLNGSEKEVVLSKKEIAELLPYITIVPWNKIYRREWLVKKNISFGEKHIFEDVCFSFQALVHAEKTALVRETLYHYRANRKFSTMASISAKNCRDVFTSLRATGLYIEAQTNDRKIQQAFNQFKVRQLITSLNGVYRDNQMTRAGRKSFFDSVRKEIGHSTDKSALGFKEKFQFFLIRKNLKNLFKWKTQLDILKSKFF